MHIYWGKVLLEDVKEYYAQEKKDTCNIRKAFDYGGTPFLKGMVSDKWGPERRESPLDYYDY